MISLVSAASLFLAIGPDTTDRAVPSSVGVEQAARDFSQVEPSRLYLTPAEAAALQYRDLVKHRDGLAAAVF